MKLWLVGVENVHSFDRYKQQIFENIIKMKSSHFKSTLTNSTQKFSKVIWVRRNLRISISNIISIRIHNKSWLKQLPQWMHKSIDAYTETPSKESPPWLVIIANDTTYSY